MTCLHCDYTFLDQDIFIGCVRDSGEYWDVIFTHCIECGNEDSRKKKGYGWVTLKRTLNEYDIITE